MTIKRHRGLETAAIVVLLFSAMLDPVLTVGLSAAMVGGVLVLGFLQRGEGHGPW